LFLLAEVSRHAYQAVDIKQLIIDISAKVALDRGPIWLTLGVNTAEMG
jgi:hypothetical protein